MYKTDVSDEPLVVIRANEADQNPVELAGRRFRRLFNEIDQLQREVKKLRKDLSSLGEELSSTQQTNMKLVYGRH